MKCSLTAFLSILAIAISSHARGGEAPSAIVEDISGAPKSIQFMDYLAPGRTIDVVASEGSFWGISEVACAKPFKAVISPLA